MQFSSLRVREVLGEPGHEDSMWPYSMPAVAQLLRDGLELTELTVLVGENGVGKSTIVEAIAMAYGLSPEGGSTNARPSERPTESSLHEHLRLVRGIGRSRWGYFLRAETLHGLLTYLEEHPGADGRYHERSHGEAFLDLDSLIIGLLGALVALALAAAVYRPVVSLVTTLPAPPFPWLAAIVGIAAGLAAGFLGGLAPSIKARRMPLVTVMRA